MADAADDLIDAPLDDDLSTSNVLLRALSAPYQTTKEAKDVSRGILTKYQSGESRERLEALMGEREETAETSRESLRSARERLLDRPVYDPALKWLRFAAAMGKPTRTGGLGESMAFGAESLAGSREAQTTAQRQREADLLGYDQALTDIDNRLSAERLGLEKVRSQNEAKLAQEALKQLGKTVTGSRGRGVTTRAAEQLDRNYVSEYTDWISTGRAGTAKSLEELSEAMKAMESSDSISGPYLGLVPKWARDVITPQSGNVQDLVELTAQNLLKTTLGAQFAKVEGEQLLARTFNPRMEEGINRQRAARLVQNITAIAEEKDRQAAHFEEHGTLAGYKAKSVYDFEGWMDELAVIGLPTITTQAEFDALPDQSEYLGKDGERRQKN